MEEGREEGEKEKKEKKERAGEGTKFPFLSFPFFASY